MAADWDSKWHFGMLNFKVHFGSGLKDWSEIVRLSLAGLKAVGKDSVRFLIDNLAFVALVALVGKQAVALFDKLAADKLAG